MGRKQLKKYDLVVVGGGFAGVAAAVSAERQGIRVLILEKMNCFGGAASNNLVLPFMYYTTNMDGKVCRLSRGIFAEITDELNKNGGMKDSYEFDEEILKLILNRMVMKSGADILFHAQVTDVRQNKDGALESLTVFYKGDEYEIHADYFIDATGDADIAYRCGYPFRLGREEDQLCQPMTLCFRVDNVDMEAFGQCRGDINALYQKFQAEGKIKNPREDVLIFTTMHQKVLHFNSTRIVRKNPTDLFDVTAAELEAREQVFELFHFLKDNFKCFENARILSTAMEIGVRESRMIDGEYCITADELKDCVRFDDTIAVGYYEIDIHNPEGSGTSHYYFKAGEYYTIPYRALLPKNTKNLIVAGRCISVTHEVQASVRIMPIVCTIGQAAGMAAAVAKKQGVDVGQVNVTELQNRLIADGAFLGQQE